MIPANLPDAGTRGRTMRDESERGCTRFFIPSYDELSLFLMSVAFLILYFADATLRAEAYDRLFVGIGLWIGIALVYFAAGMAFSIYHAFATRPKTEPEKLAMFFFAVIASYASAIASAIYIFKEAPWWFFVF